MKSSNQGCKSRDYFFKEVFNYSFFVFICMIADLINQRAGQLVLGIYKGPEEVAVFAVAASLVGIYSQFSGAISGMFVPRMTIMSTNKASGEELTDEFIKISRIQLIIIGYILLGFFYWVMTSLIYG
ncbi:lipopolysaccharide biosynthesis protein [Bacillus sp. N9]